MKQWQQCKVLKSSTILETMRIIDQSALQIALVVDENEKLLGLVTDGDIRRTILKNGSLEEAVSTIMNKNPVTVNEDQERHAIIAKMRDKELQQVPIVNNLGAVVGLISLKEFTYERTKENAVVLMVGGLGTRLRPLTDKCPKPLLKIGNKPILETILENFIEAGFRKFYFAVNYKAAMIENYFGDGSKYGADIKYLYEKKRMGTAGALSLLPEKMNLPVIIMNGDLLTKVNFEQLLKYHETSSAWATMAVREYNYQIPYGVIHSEENKIVNIQEKPIQSVFVNAGIYVLSPKAIERVNKEEFFDMPDLFQELICEGQYTVAFPIREYWMDIGKIDDFQRAQQEYGEMFE